MQAVGIWLTNNRNCDRNPRNAHAHKGTGVLDRRGARLGSPEKAAGAQLVENRRKTRLGLGIKLGTTFPSARLSRSPQRSPRSCPDPQIGLGCEPEGVFHRIHRPYYFWIFMTHGSVHVGGAAFSRSPLFPSRSGMWKSRWRTGGKAAENRKRAEDNPEAPSTFPESFYAPSRSRRAL